MENLNLGELYTMALHMLRKDRKGSVTPEEFEAFAKKRNLDYFQKKLAIEGKDEGAHESLVPFMKYADTVDLVTLAGETLVILDPDAVAPLVGPSYNIAKIINAWACDDDSSYANKIRIDIVNSAEYYERLGNAITGPSNDDPIGYITNISGAGDEGVMIVHGGSGFISSYPYVLLDYYKWPTEPYFDYYTDANGNITYLTEDRATYTLLAGEVSRSGDTAGTGVDSVSKDFDWDDDDALAILEMIISDISIALSDSNSYQASLLERKDD